MDMSPVLKRRKVSDDELYKLIKDSYAFMERQDAFMRKQQAYMEERGEESRELSGFMVDVADLEVKKIGVEIEKVKAGGVICSKHIH